MSSSVIVRSILIIFNLVAFTLGILSVICCVALPDETYAGGWDWWHLLVYNVIFVLVALIGIFGSCYVGYWLLVAYTFSMFVLISSNFVIWIFIPERALMDTPEEVVLITSLFDIGAMLCSSYLVYKIRKTRRNNKVTPTKSSMDVLSLTQQP